MLIVSIEAFSTLLGIGAAFYLYLYERYHFQLLSLERRLRDYLSHIREVFARLDLILYHQLLYIEEQAIDLGKMWFLNEIYKLFKRYEDKMDDIIQMETGPSTVRKEVDKVVYKIDDIFTEYELLKEHGGFFPNVLFIILLIFSAIPIIFSLIHLNFLTYQIPIQKHIGYTLLMIDIFFLLFFVFIMIISINIRQRVYKKHYGHIGRIRKRPPFSTFIDAIDYAISERRRRSRRKKERGKK